MADLLVVFGSGDHAKVVIEAALASNSDREIVLLDDDQAKKGRTIFGIAVIGGREQLEILGGVSVALGIGDNHARSALLRSLTEQGRSLETIVHPATVVGRSVQVGKGAFLGAGAIALADARIGPGAIINTGATVDHDCEIGTAAHLAPGVHLCGNVRVGDRTLVGVGSSIKPGVSIAADVVIGAGTVVVRDIDIPGTYVGNPARPLKQR